MIPHLEHLTSHPHLYLPEDYHQDSFHLISSLQVKRHQAHLACPPKVVPSVKLVVVQTERKSEYDT